MLILNLISNPILLFGFLLSITLALSVHEYAHAWIAYKLGDNSAKLAGRVTLNPLAHFDPIGTIFLLLAGFGWGKPVPVNPRNFRNPKIDELKVALAGPISNLLFALLLSLIVKFIAMPPVMVEIIIVMVQINITLMIFNLLPLPPLDGSTILQLVLPEESYQTIRQLSFPLLIAFLIFIYATPYFSNFLSNVTNFLMRILLG